MANIIDQDHARCGAWIADKMKAAYFGEPAIGLEVGGDLVAVVTYAAFNGKSFQPHICFDGLKFIPREYLWFIFYYPFVQCDAEVLIAMVPSSNEKALRFDQHLGFKPSHVIQGAHPDGDLIVLTMHKADCKWIKRENLYRKIP